MSTRYQALYIRADTPERVARIAADAEGPQDFFERMPVIANGWVEHGGSADSPDPGGAASAREASRVFGEATYVGFQENVGSFIYGHAIEGELRRHLQYNADAGWFVVEGTPEPWEEALLFADERRHSLLAEANDDDDPASRRAQVEAAFSRKQLAAGDVIPWVWSDHLFHAVLGRLAG